MAETARPRTKRRSTRVCAAAQGAFALADRPSRPRGLVGGLKGWDCGRGRALWQGGGPARRRRVRSRLASPTPGWAPRPHVRPKAEAGRGHPEAGRGTRSAPAAMEIKYLCHVVALPSCSRKCPSSGLLKNTRRPSMVPGQGWLSRAACKSWLRLSHGKPRVRLDLVIIIHIYSPSL